MPVPLAVPLRDALMEPVPEAVLVPLRVPLAVCVLLPVPDAVPLGVPVLVRVPVKLGVEEREAVPLGVEVREELRLGLGVGNDASCEATGLASDGGGSAHTLRLLCPAAVLTHCPYLASYKGPALLQLRGTNPLLLPSPVPPLTATPQHTSGSADACGMDGTGAPSNGGSRPLQNTPDALVAFCRAAARMREHFAPYVKPTDDVDDGVGGGVGRALALTGVEVALELHPHGHCDPVAVVVGV